MDRPYFQIVKQNGVYWIADEVDFVGGPFLELWQAERELEYMTEEEEEDEEDDE